MIDESETASDDPLNKVRTKLMKLYANNDASPDHIGASVERTKTAYGVTFGHLAEFWLLLSVGEVLAHPRQAYGLNAGIYRQRARKCDDASPEIIIKHGELVGELLPIRLGPNDIRANIAVTYIKQVYDVLAEDLVSTS